MWANVWHPPLRPTWCTAAPSLPLPQLLPPVPPRASTPVTPTICGCYGESGRRMCEAGGKGRSKMECGVWKTTTSRATMILRGVCKKPSRALPRYSDQGYAVLTVRRLWYRTSSKWYECAKHGHVTAAKVVQEIVEGKASGIVLPNDLRSSCCK